MTEEVFRSELKKRGFDEEQITRLKAAAEMVVMLEGDTINKAFNVVFDAALNILNEIQAEVMTARSEQMMQEILYGTGDREPKGIIHGDENGK